MNITNKKKNNAKLFAPKVKQFAGCMLVLGNIIRYSESRLARNGVNPEHTEG